MSANQAFKQEPNDGREEPAAKPLPEELGNSDLASARLGNGVTSKRNGALHEQLRRLWTGQQLIVAPDGYEAEQCTVGLMSRQTTFRKLPNGDFLIRDGSPSKNGTYVQSSDGSFGALSGSVIIRAGQTVRFSGVEATVPSDDYESDEEPGETGEALFQARLARMDIGSKRIIGRHRELADIVISDEMDVSRQHATIERLPDVDLDGVKQRCYRLTEGYRSILGTYIETNGSWHEIGEWRSVSPGTRIRLGSLDHSLIVEIPAIQQEELRETAIERSTRINRIVPDIKGHELVLGNFTQCFANSSVSYAINSGVELNHELNRRPDQVNLIAVHIRDGLKLIRDGDYDGARRLFEDAKLLELAGYDYQGNRVYGLPRNITAEKVYDTLVQIASSSWFMRQNLVYPSFGMLHKDYDYPNAPQDEKELIDEFFREVALIYAEEWTHAYQHAFGANVSKKGALIGGGDSHEIDVAQFFKEQRVPMSDAYLLRYGRDTELEKLKGIQTAAQTAEVSNRLAGLTPGAEITIGRSGDICIERPVLEDYLDEHPMLRAQISQKKIKSGEIESFLRRTFKNISGEHVRIKKLAEGGFELTRTTNAEIFVPDSHGIWRAAEKTAHLTAGSRFRLGQYFEMAVP